MTETQKDAVLLSFIQTLKAHGSWCGETHIQKGTYLFQDLLKVPLGFEFVLYKHGPYSFDLKDELTDQLAHSLLDVKSRLPYGPSLLPGENGLAMLERMKLSRKRYHLQADFVASRLGTKKVPDLERLATAVFITLRELPHGSVDERAVRINELKPHVSLDLAHEAVIEADKLITDARSVEVESE